MDEEKLRELIWAPWRIGYIEGCDRPAPSPLDPGLFLPGADPGCFLCQAVADAQNPERLVICRDQLSVVVLNRYPYNNGHLLIAPLRHVGHPADVSPEEHTALMFTLTRMIRLLEQSLQPDGFNVGLNLGRVAGAGLPGHLHWHVVPRWNGDTNFMPVLAGAKVIPQSLAALWQLLREKLRQEPPPPQPTGVVTKNDISQPNTNSPRE